MTNLKNSGVDISGVKVLGDKKTDGRIITVDKRGETRMEASGTPRLKGKSGHPQRRHKSKR